MATSTEWGLCWLNSGEAQAYEMSCLEALRWADGVLAMGFAEPRNGVNENLPTVYGTLIGRCSDAVQ
jgi:hypothetical protein